MNDLLIKIIETAYNMTKDTVNPSVHGARWEKEELDSVFAAHYAAIVKAINDNPPPSPETPSVPSAARAKRVTTR